MTPKRIAVLGVFLVTFLSYAYFWQSRDWNTASRLMLTYAMGDRGTISISGLDRQTGDKAYFRGKYYSDKLPGYSFLALPPYLASKLAFRLPSHPLDRPGFALWTADYWVTLATSGLATALCSVLLVWLSMELGCSALQAAFVGLAHGLATPAYAYATLAYGHQASALGLFASFALLWKRRGWLSALSAGFCAAYASVIELQVGPVSAILGIWCLIQAILKQRTWSSVIYFALGALVPTLFLGFYNMLAFGSPLDMGYFHHATPRFAEVHSKENPLGLKFADLKVAYQLMAGEKRGLLMFAPIVALVPFGHFSMMRKGEKAASLIISAVMISIFFVNLSYPEWTGGWSTGPRLLVPLLPFAMLAVGACLANGPKWLFPFAFVLGVLGWIEMTLFLGVGARIPDPIDRPLRDAVLPLWSGAALPGWATGGRFARTVWDLGVNPKLGTAMAFLPLVLGQFIMSFVLLFACWSRSHYHSLNLMDQSPPNRRIL